MKLRFETATDVIKTDGDLFVILSHPGGVGSGWPMDIWEED